MVDRIDLCIYVSDVAGCIGETEFFWKYNNHQAGKLEKYIQKYKGKEEEYSLRNYKVSEEEVKCIKKEFNTLVHQPNVETIKKNEEKFKQIETIKDPKRKEKELSSLNKKIIETASSSIVKEENVSLKNKEKQKFIKKVSKNISKENVEKITTEIKSSINKNTGTLKEQDDLNRYEKKHDKNVVQRNSKTYYKTILKSPFGDLFLCGKIDGRVDDVLLETKHREKEFKGFPEYEKIQIECYLRMLYLDKAILTENYNNQQRVYEYTLCDERWEKIKKGLINFKKIFEGELLLMDE